VVSLVVMAFFYEPCWFIKIFSGKLATKYIKAVDKSIEVFNA